MRALKRGGSVIAALVVIAAAVWGYSSFTGAHAPADEVPAAAEGPYSVARVVDGDTLTVSAAAEELTVRLIGIDTPETRHPGKGVECWGPEATELMEDLAAGTEVYLEADDSQGATDRYDRQLAYVWRADGTLLNLEMITRGAGKEYTYDKPYRYVRSFKAAQRTAQDQGLGLWGACS